MMMFVSFNSNTVGASSVVSLFVCLLNGV